MSFKYLDSKRWSEITRDERFFCQRLYEHIRTETPERFVAFLVGQHGLNVSTSGLWEVGFEVCFYRDLWQHRGRADALFSPKRTFDLCLFGENAIIIIEAKAAQGFDAEQTAAFVADIAEVKRLTAVERVELVGLRSSKYAVKPDLASAFTGGILTWKELGVRYAGDPVLLRADEVFERPSSSQNSDQKLNGARLLEAFHAGEAWWVGRNGGLLGAAFRADLQTRSWKAQLYEVNTTANQAPSRNYFSLMEFAAAVVEAWGRSGE